MEGVLDHILKVAEEVNGLPGSYDILFCLLQEGADTSIPSIRANKM